MFKGREQVGILTRVLQSSKQEGGKSTGPPQTSELHRWVKQKDTGLETAIEAPWGGGDVGSSHGRVLINQVDHY